LFCTYIDEKESVVATNFNNIADRLWDAADKLRANTHLRASEYSVPVLGLIFLKFADQKFAVIDRILQEHARQSDPDQIEILLMLRSSNMPTQEEREQALEVFRHELADVIDWDSAQYNNGLVLMHT